MTNCFLYREAGIYSNHRYRSSILLLRGTLVSSICKGISCILYVRGAKCMQIHCRPNRCPIQKLGCYIYVLTKKFPHLPHKGRYAVPCDLL
uniref:Uncharacterized protein n=1 Tax=Pyxicephalus adspersus TaxID=30357 RepID=A0AAV3A009_PYXAD|nr:TPA: hypothetical protein GDO54_017627 [Pyxicephalus adspersus]